MRAIERLFCLVFLVLFLIGAVSAEAAKPKLVIAIAVDQMRADYLMRFTSRFLPPSDKKGTVGGFRYLMEKGAYFPYAEYGLLQCMTGPGHATILSGSLAYQNGINLNTWYEHKTGKPMYCVSDESVSVVSDQPVKTSYTGSHSPKNFQGTTVGDELKNAGHPSRVVAIALKDRAAILLGGKRADAALWYDGKSNQWISSTYYFPDKKLPSWVTQLNNVLRFRTTGKITWKAEGPGTGLSEPASPAREIEKGSYESLALPWGLEITTDAAERAFDGMNLGRGKDTDLLAVSYSSHDYLGHAMGPNSRDMEEMTVADDREISRLLNHVRAKMPGGLKDVLIVLTADHGIPPTPDYAAANKLGGGRISEEELAKAVNEKLTDRFGKAPDGKWVVFVNDFNFYLSPKAIADNKVDPALAEAVTKEVLLQNPGIDQVITASEVRARRLPPALLGKLAGQTFFEGRSGDVIGIPKPYFIPKAPAGMKEGTTHLTHYDYDRIVPLVFSGPGIKPGKYATRAEVIDIAPTLTYLLGVMPPAMSEGRVLSEVISAK